MHMTYNVIMQFVVYVAIMDSICNYLISWWMTNYHLKLWFFVNHHDLTGYVYMSTLKPKLQSKLLCQ